MAGPRAGCGVLGAVVEHTARFASLLPAGMPGAGPLARDDRDGKVRQSIAVLRYLASDVAQADRVEEQACSRCHWLQCICQVQVRGEWCVYVTSFWL